MTNPGELCSILHALAMNRGPYKLSAKKSEELRSDPEGQFTRELAHLCGRGSGSPNIKSR